MLKGGNKELQDDFYRLLREETKGLTVKKAEIILDFIKNTFPGDQSDNIFWYNIRKRWLKSTIAKYEGLLEKLKLLEKHFGAEIEEQTDSEIKRDALDHLRLEIEAKLKRNKEKSGYPGWYKTKAEKLAVALKYLNDIDTGTYEVLGRRRWVDPPRRYPEILAPESPREDSPKPRRAKSPPSVDIDLLDSDEEDKKKRRRKKVIDLTRSESLECLVCGIAGVALSREHTRPHRIFCGEDCQREFYFKE
jgi:hypothetical protein